MKQRVVKLTPVEAAHILSILYFWAGEGNYWGPKEQFWKRHERIVTKLEEANG